MPFHPSTDENDASRATWTSSIPNKSDNPLLSVENPFEFYMAEASTEFPINRERIKRRNDRKLVLFGYATHHMFLYGFVEKECSRTPSSRQCYLHTWAEKEGKKTAIWNDSLAEISRISRRAVPQIRSGLKENVSFFPVESLDLARNYLSLVKSISTFGGFCNFKHGQNGLN